MVCLDSLALRVHGDDGEELTLRCREVTLRAWGAEQHCVPCYGNSAFAWAEGEAVPGDEPWRGLGGGLAHPTPHQVTAHLYHCFRPPSPLSCPCPRSRTSRSLRSG